MRRANRLAAAEARRADCWGGVLLLVAIIVALVIASGGGELPDGTPPVAAGEWR